MKNKFSKIISSNEQLSNDLKASNSLKCELDKSKEENEKLLKEMLELKNSISKFHKGKESLDNILVSQKGHGDKFGLGYAHKTPSSSSISN